MNEPLSILVIDDEASVCDALEIVLTDAGYEVASASTGLRGVEMARAQRFDLAITDLNLPDIDGLKVLAQIEEIDPPPAVIVITAYKVPELIAETERPCVLGLLSKPFSPSDLLTLIDTAFGKR